MSEHRPEIFPISIGRLVAQAASGEIDVPEFQREFVWNKDQVREFLDSLIKRFPVGMLII